jgi:hypothetical protein
MLSWHFSADGHALKVVRPKIRGIVADKYRDVNVHVSTAYDTVQANVPDAHAIGMGCGPAASWRGSFGGAAPKVKRPTPSTVLKVRCTLCKHAKLISQEQQ